MSTNPGNQYRNPNNKPDKELGSEKNQIKENKREDIIEGATQEDQLEQLKPDEETARRVKSESVPDENKGENNS